MTATQMQWKRTRDELVDEIRALGFPDELGHPVMYPLNENVDTIKMSKE